MFCFFLKTDVYGYICTNTFLDTFNQNKNIVGQFLVQTILFLLSVCL